MDGDMAQVLLLRLTSVTRPLNRQLRYNSRMLARIKGDGLELKVTQTFI
jgi:hypothetical protein